MQLKIKFLAVILFTIAVSGFLFARQAKAADQYCYCKSNLSNIQSFQDLNNPAKTVVFCSATPINVSACSREEIKKIYNNALDLDCETVATQQQCVDKRRVWSEQKDEKLRKTGLKEGVNQGHWLIPDCALQDKLDLQGECGDVSIFVKLLINFGRGLFGIIGSFALAFFIYGGFVLIVSQGNAEKVQKGKDIMVAAFIGLFVAFAGYLVVQFLGEAVGLKGEFRL